MKKIVIAYIFGIFMAFFLVGWWAGGAVVLLDPPGNKNC